MVMYFKYKSINRPDGSTIKTPSIPISIIGNSGLRIEFTALIDSGADISFISKNIGFLLQQEMIEETKRLYNKYIWLSVLKSNERALTFYTKGGFLYAGEHAYDIGSERFEFFVLKMEL